MRASPGASGTPSSSNGVANTGQTPEMGRASAVADAGIERFHSDPNGKNKGIADTVSTLCPSVNTTAVFGYNSYLRDFDSHKALLVALVPIILSGGAGTRLWPLSRESAPKPFMPLPDGETLLAKAVMRAIALPSVTELITVTNRDYYFHTKDVYAGAGVPPPQVVYLLEPFGRNTAAAVGLAAMCVEATSGADSTLLVLPADHLIRDAAAFAV